MKYPSQAAVGHFHKLFSLCERRELQHKSDGKLTWGRPGGRREPSITSVPLSGRMELPQIQKVYFLEVLSPLWACTVWRY